MNPKAVVLNCLAVLAGMPFALLGVACCLTVIGIPIGLFLFGVAGMPLYWVQRRALKRKINYELGEGLIARTHEGEVPWVL